MNASLLCCMLAWSSSWANPTQVLGRWGPNAEVLASNAPYGLLDELLDREIGKWHFPGPERTGTLRGGDSHCIEELQPPTSLLRARRDFIIRAQSPVPRVADGSSDPEVIGQPVNPPPFRPTFSASQPQTFVAPSQPTQTQPDGAYEPEQAPTTTTPLYLQPSPFMTAPPPASIPGASTWGANGPQPYRLGLSASADMAWLSPEGTSLDNSRFEIFETNIGLNYTTPAWWSPWLFSLEHQFGYRSWQGPGIPDLPGSVFRFGWDFRMETPLNSQFAPFAVSLAFNPSINSDVGQSISRDAINLDGRGILFWQVDPRFMIGLGAQFWDRVHDRVIPYAGFVWQPDDRWEFRIMWPQSRISWYLGNVMGDDFWLYATGEYRVESYEIDSSTVAAGEDQIELEDYRVLIGLRKCNPFVSGFVEGGWVFGRNASLRDGPDFDINSGFLIRLGIRF